MAHQVGWRDATVEDMQALYRDGRDTGSDARRVTATLSYGSATG